MRKYFVDGELVMSMADDIIDGVCCEGCGVFLGDGDGFPQRCKACGGDAVEYPGPDKNQKLGKALGVDEGQDIKQAFKEKREDQETFRVTSTKRKLQDMGYEIGSGPDGRSYTILKGGKKLAHFWPYKGWFATLGFAKIDPRARGFKVLLEN